jgi:hypothetical protein
LAIFRRGSKPVGIGVDPGVGVKVIVGVGVTVGISSSVTENENPMSTAVIDAAESANETLNVSPAAKAMVCVTSEQEVSDVVIVQVGLVPLHEGTAPAVLWQIVKTMFPVGATLDHAWRFPMVILYGASIQRLEEVP